MTALHPLYTKRYHSTYGPIYLRLCFPCTRVMAHVRNVMCSQLWTERSISSLLHTQWVPIKFTRPHSSRPASSKPRLRSTLTMLGVMILGCRVSRCYRQPRVKPEIPWRRSSRKNIYLIIIISLFSFEREFLQHLKFYVSRTFDFNNSPAMELFRCLCLPFEKKINIWISLNENIKRSLNYSVKIIYFVQRGCLIHAPGGKEMKTLQKL